MSVHKLLNRVVTPDTVDYQRESVDAIASDVHNYTVSKVQRISVHMFVVQLSSYFMQQLQYGITSDALSQFAIVFSALIHDV